MPKEDAQRLKSIIPMDDPDRCYLCGRYRPEHVHHCMHGPNRKNADRYGLTVHLCTACHMALHDTGTKDLELEQTAQKAFESKYSRNEWMRLFGKNYL